ncbi:MAG: ABC transporter substrate-binding protein [Streptosporangiaceae bacterium]|nr:ABC transporter substrate-binding protein [Streptosporangiaceae bacterium]MBV9853136.1 ABC transporter substrate-binding protein [Streptosporangiaceae bacterium]
MRRLIAAAAAGGALLLAGCSSSSSANNSPAASGSTSGTTGSAPVTVRLGFLENITHASALVGIKEGFFSKALGSAGTVQTTAFSSGTQETTAILAGQLDAAYVGPNPTINAWQKSGGTAIKVVSGAAAGGASIVVKPGISSASQLKGQSLATPSLGNTQDVALRYWLKTNGLATSATGGGDVLVKPTAPNSAAVLEFKSGQIAGGSEPAPYDVEMVKDGGKVLLSEPGVTTLLVVTQSFLSAHPAVVADLLKAQIQANDFIKSNPAGAQTAANDELASYTGKPLKASIVAASFKEIKFTDDPDASSLTADAQQAVSLGLLKPVTLTGIFDLGPLNKALAAAGEAQVSS